MTNAKTEFSSALDEVVMSIHFNELNKLSILHLAELIGNFANKGFSKGEERPIVSPLLEPSQTQEVILDAQINITPLFPRIWLIHQRGNKIIQIQRDRFTFNWRRHGSYTDIPAYSVVFQEFKKLYDEFTKFTNIKQIGSLKFYTI